MSNGQDPYPHAETPHGLKPDAGAHSTLATGSALREMMAAARKTVAYWEQAYEDEHEENQRLRAKLRETKKYLRDANKGARILSLAFQLSSARHAIRSMQSPPNDQAHA